MSNILTLIQGVFIMYNTNVFMFKFVSVQLIYLFSYANVIVTIGPIGPGVTR